MKNLIFIISILIFQFNIAQNFHGGGITVIENDIILKNPWGGGFDMPQFSSSDIDNDNKKDLIVFDKKGNKWLIYLNEGNEVYKYAPQYEKLFPSIIKMGLIRDFNCDGYGDIFAHTNQGIKVYRNTHEEANPSFVLEKNILKYPAPWGLNNIYKFNNDIPAIDDFDGDGDIDILSFDLLGTTIPFYRNLSVENGHDCDSLVFEENTVCWGNFKESSSDNSVELNISCKGSVSSSGSGLMHTGSTLAILDEEEDGDMDLLLGDVAYNNLVFLRNGGTNLSANMVSSEDNFPSYNTPISVPIFPASFYLDVDNDGLKDLLISPNAYTSSVNKDCVWYYKNTGNATSRFSLQRKNFLVKTQLDNGSNSNITFFDHDSDGLLDMIIGNEHVYDESGNTKSFLKYYRNTGSSTIPEFTLANNNYAFVNNFNLKDVSPTFGDIDGDGDQDMLIGERNGGIHFFINSAGAGNPSNIGFSSLNFFNLDVGTNSMPQLIDLNNDGLLDLVVGRKSPVGNIAYYRNFGTATVPLFHQDTVNNKLGNIHVEDPGFLFGNSAPFIGDEDVFGNRYIYVGSDLGFIHKYKINIDSLESGSFEEIDDAILEVKAGLRTTINIVDINNDGKLDYFIGNSRGGIHFYSDAQLDTTLVLAIKKNHIKEFDFNIFPNPTNKILNIEIENDKKELVQMEIVNILGKTLFETNFTDSKKALNLNLSKGIYFIVIKKGKEKASKKLLIK